MSFSTLSTLSLTDIDNVFRYLPEPSTLEVQLYWFDYSDLNRQLTETIQGLNLVEPNNWQRFHVKNPTKQLILDIYKHSENMMISDKKSDCKGKFRRVDFHQADWYPKNNNVYVTLTPHSFDIKYPVNVKEPDFIKQIRETFSGQNINLTITQSYLHNTIIFNS